MKLREIYNSKKPVISLEIFPPKPDGADFSLKTKSLIKELDELKEFNPSFISVTYGAGGSTREKTLDLVFEIKDKLKIMSVPHFTCVGSSRDDILDYLNHIKNKNIKNILALRGDPPKGEKEFVKPEDGFGYANELVEYIKSRADFGIAVAGYPEGHQESESLEADIINLKRKVDAGADVIITQLFYDNKLFFKFVEKVREMGIDIPIIPGILPITSISQIEKILSMCSCTLPDSLNQKLQEYQNNPDVIKQIGIEFAIEQCRELVQNNVSGIHFYTLNKAFATKEVLKDLNLSCRICTKY